MRLQNQHQKFHNSFSEQMPLSLQGFQYDPHCTDFPVTTSESMGLGAKGGFWFQGCSCRAEALSSGNIKQILSGKRVRHPSYSKEIGNKLINGGILNKDSCSPDFVKSVSSESCIDTSNQWWEAPPGTGSRGRAVTCTFPLQQTYSTPTQSDVTFEGGNAWNAFSDSELSLHEDSATSCKAHAPDAEIMCESLNDSSPDTSGSSKSDSGRATATEAESQGHHKVRKKEKTYRWSEEDGKMVIKNDVFAAVLPGSDEVGLQWRISELRVALRASERARLESERETEALRKYLAEVEAAAAGLQSRAQELEHLIAYSSKDETRELDKLRAKMVMEASKETRNQAATAVQAVAAAREATMELDKLKRHASALIKSQEEEIERLSMEAAECRTLYQARVVQLQALKDQLETIEQNVEIDSKAAEDALKVSHEEIMDLQNQVESAKLAAQEKAVQHAKLLKAFELTKRATQAAEIRLAEAEREKKELISHSEWLEKQVTDFQNQEVAATIAHYDHELCKVRAVLGDEKKHLLAELASLRHGNQTLQGELVEWQEKFHALTCHVSESELMPPANNSTVMVETAVQCSVTSKETSAQTMEGENCAQLHQQELEQWKICNKDTFLLRESGNEFSSCFSGRTADTQCLTPPLEKANGSFTSKLDQNDNKQECSKFVGGNWDMHSTESRSVQLPYIRKDLRVRENRKACPTGDCSSCQKTSLLLRDELLAAAHREIVKLKEVNQCLVDVCQKEFGLTKERKEDPARGKRHLGFSIH